MTNNQDIEPSIEIEPTQPATHSIIWLHGLGADGGDFASLPSELKLPNHMNIRYIFPHAPFLPVTINNGYVMRAWYDITALTIDNKTDEVNIAQSRSQIGNVIAREIKRGIPAKNIILGGFSQGAAMALLTGLAYHPPLAGVIALSGYLPPMANQVSPKVPGESGIPIFMGHGSADGVVPYALGKASYLKLQAQGFSPTLHTYPIAHTVSLQEINDIRSWILKIWE